MSISDKVKSLLKNIWNNAKSIVTDPKTYFALATFSIGGYALAQNNSETNNLKTKYSAENSINNNKLQKTNGEYYIHGKVTGTDAQGLQGIEVKIRLYDETWPSVADSFTTTTNSQGYFNYIFTGIDETVIIENIGEIKYNIINTPTIELNLNELSKVEMKIYDLLGQEIKTLLNEEINQKKINADINNLSSGVYILETIINGKPYTNKVLKTEKGYSYGKDKEQVSSETKTKIEKTVSIISYYGVELTDPSGQYYKQQSQQWNLWEVNSTDISVKLPMLEKGTVTPFNNPRTGALVNEVNELEYFLAGSDIIPNGNTLYYPSKKPILVYNGFDNLPSNFNIADVNAGTEYMMSTTSLNPDSLWKTIDHYINPFDTLNCVMNYLYLDNTTMQGYDIIVTYYSKPDQTTGFDFSFNKDSIEPEYIKKAVQMAIQFGIDGIMAQVPTSDAHSQDLRNGIETLNDGERKVYNHLLQVDNRMWIGPDIIGPNSSITQPLEYEKPAGVEIYKIKFTGSEPIIKKEFIDIKTYKEKHNQMKNE